MDTLNKSVVTSKKNLVKLILYFITLVILGLLIYYAYTSYITYKGDSEFYNTEETLLIDDWKLGTTAKVASDKQLPQSMIANEYSFTCLIYLQDLKETDKHTDQILLTKGKHLDIKIPPLIDNPLNNLKLSFKLQSEIETPNEEGEVADGEGGEAVGAGGEEAGGAGGDEFSNTDINSNVVDYFTVQSIYPTELFSSITKETFGDDNNNQVNIDALTEIIKDDATVALTDVQKTLFADMITSYQRDKNNDKAEKKYKTHDSIGVNNNTTKTVFHIGVVIYNNIVDIYINSNLVSSKSLRGLPIVNNEPFIFFPKSNFNGYVNKFTYFNKALNHEDIQNNYKKYYNKILNKIPFLP